MPLLSFFLDFSLEFGGETSDHDSEPTGSVIMRFVPSQDEKRNF